MAGNLRKGRKIRTLRITMNKNKSYIYEIKLPEELMHELKESALLWGEELEAHIEHVLKEGLHRLAATQEKYRALEETEERLRHI